MYTITADHAAAYLRHIIGGETIREISRAERVHASTVLRRVQYIEDSRDCPVWSQIWDVISRAYAAPKSDVPCGFDHVALLHYLGTTPSDVASALAVAMIAPRSSVSILVGSETPRAAVLRKVERVATISRAEALGLVLVGAARCNPGGSERVASLELTGQTPEVLKQAPPEPQPIEVPPTPEAPRRITKYPMPHGAALIGLLEHPRANSSVRFSDDHISLTWMMIESAQADPDRFLDAIADLNLGEDITKMFKALIVDGVGFEAAEKALGWPCRAAKLVFMIGLDLARARGFAA